MGSAGAGGIGMLSTSAQAKIVYTPANAVTSYGTIPVDLNNDGVVDFTISVQGGFFHSEWTFVKPQVTGNAVLAAAGGGVAAGFFGVPVGPGEKILSHTFYSYGMWMADAGIYIGSSSVIGPFGNISERFHCIQVC